jgi:prepilin-type N-terminal cleavage/methylation domain-containing protein
MSAKCNVRSAIITERAPGLAVGRPMCRPLATGAIFFSMFNSASNPGSKPRTPRIADGPAAGRAAFTLVELLVVIAIISIIAAMVAGMSIGASRAKKDTLVKAEKEKLIALIESYHSKMGFYPPDNGNLLLLPAGVGWGSPQYEEFTATNQLLYELTGATNPVPNPTPANPSFFSFDGSNISASAFNAAYARGGIANSDPSQPQNFFNPLPNVNDYTNYPGGTFKGLTLPIDTVSSLNPFQTVHLNFWHYDASTTNRHNPSSFDIWAEYYVGRDHMGHPIMITNGNW